MNVARSKSIRYRECLMLNESSRLCFFHDLLYLPEDLEMEQNGQQDRVQRAQKPW